MFDRMTMRGKGTRQQHPQKRKTYDTAQTRQMKRRKGKKQVKKPNYNKHVLKETLDCQVLICDML